MNRFTHTLPEELRRAAQEAPDQPFIRMLQGEWSFRQVDDGSSRLAGGLLQAKTVFFVFGACVFSNRW